MCEENDLTRFSRRRFGAVGAAAAIAGCSGTKDASAGDAGSSLAEKAVTIPTEEGALDARLIHPAGGSHPAVIMWPDIAGIRPAAIVMARRLAAEGCAVLVPNPYYRDAPAPQFTDFADLMGQGFATVGPWRERLTPEAVMRDSTSIVAWLDAQEVVDSALPIGANGHCMTGSWTVYAAHAVPGRVKAAASMHGGSLVRDGDPTSPHELLAGTQAFYLFAIGQNDDDKEPFVKDALRAAAADAGVRAEIEVYPADHGWTVLDSPAYDREQAERAWARMLALFGTALA